MARLEILEIPVNLDFTIYNIPDCFRLEMKSEGDFYFTVDDQGMSSVVKVDAGSYDTGYLSSIWRNINLLFKNSSPITLLIWR